VSYNESEALIAQYLASLGADPETDPRLTETPQNVTGVLQRFASRRSPPDVSLFPCAGETVVTLRDIRFYSLCEHHLLPFFGTIDIAYRPKDQVAGFGGIHRAVRHFSTQLQLQERLTRDLAAFLFIRLQPMGLGVVSRARQLCSEMTGGSPDVIVTSMACRGEMTEVELAQLLTI